MPPLPIHPARLTERSLRFEINNFIQPANDSRPDAVINEYYEWEAGEILPCIYVYVLLHTFMWFLSPSLSRF